MIDVNIIGMSFGVIIMIIGLYIVIFDVIQINKRKVCKVKKLEKTISSVLLGLECLYEDELKCSQTMSMLKHQIETLKGNNVMINNEFNSKEKV